MKLQVLEPYLALGCLLTQRPPSVSPTFSTTTIPHAMPHDNTYGYHLPVASSQTIALTLAVSQAAVPLCLSPLCSPGPSTGADSHFRQGCIPPPASISYAVACTSIDNLYTTYKSPGDPRVPGVCSHLVICFSLFILSIGP